MKIVLNKPTLYRKSLLLQTSPQNFLKAISRSNFKVGNPKFDISIFTKVVRAIRKDAPIAPVTMYVTAQGQVTQASKAEGLYVAAAAIALNIDKIPVYTFIVDPQGQLLPPTLVELPEGFESHSARPPSLTNWLAYSWYRFKPISKNPLKIADIKGEKFEIEPGTVYGLLAVKTGIRLVDADTPKSFCVIKEQRATKLMEFSVRLKKCPVIVEDVKSEEPEPIFVVTPEVKKEHKIKIVVKPIVTDTEAPAEVHEDYQRVGDDDEFEDDTPADMKSRIIDVGEDDELQNYKDVDDLSVELYGYNLDEEGFDYDSLNSIVANKVSTSSTALCSLGSTYKEFFVQNSIADNARVDPNIAEHSLSNIVTDLHHFLSQNGFQVDIISGKEFTPTNLTGCSDEIMKHEGKPIKHLAVKVGNVVLDPCFKRLGQEVRLDNYPLPSFQRLWKIIRTEESNDPLRVTTVPGQGFRSPVSIKPHSSIFVPGSTLTKLQSRKVS